MIVDCLSERREVDVPELIPARMLNEFAYCPRLAYLEWVQGEFADNLEVQEGRFGHRRLDRPDRQEVPVPGQQKGKRGWGEGQRRGRGDRGTGGRRFRR